MTPEVETFKETDKLVRNRTEERGEKPYALSSILHQERLIVLS